MQFATVRQALLEATRKHVQTYISLGFLPVPLVSNTKRPACKLKGLQASPVEYWEGSQLYGVALLCGSRGGGLIVVDCENDWDAELLHTRFGAGAVIFTPRGQHLWFRSSTTVSARQGVPFPGCRQGVDIRGEGTLATVPPTIINGCQYRQWRLHKVQACDKLPAFRQCWLPEKVQTQLQLVDCDEPPGAGKINDPEAYVMQIPAVSGAAGHAATYRVACVLIDAGLGFEQAMQVMRRWNENNAQPKWSNAELEHKVRSAQSRKGNDV